MFSFIFSFIVLNLFCQRKFRRQTSDWWTHAATVKERVREERVSRKKIQAPTKITKGVGWFRRVERCRKVGRMAQTSGPQWTSMNQGIKPTKSDDNAPIAWWWWWWWLSLLLLLLLLFLLLLLWLLCSKKMYVASLIEPGAQRPPKTPTVFLASLANHFWIKSNIVSGCACSAMAAVSRGSSLEYNLKFSNLIMTQCHIN